MSGEPHSFAYLFERFPSFVQTFVYREAEEMVRQGMNPWLVSIRRPDDSGDLTEQLDVSIFYAAEEKELRAEVDARRSRGQLPRKAHRAIPKHRKDHDSQRMFEAIWLAPLLRARGIRHVHAHFGGVAARTAWWLCELFGFTYSFTGHANDIFCETDFPVSNTDLVRAARFVITETDYARRWMEGTYPWAKGKIFRVFNGIAMAGFPSRNPDVNEPRIISVGRYVEKKGFRDLIEACGQLREQGVPFHCEIIGGGPLEGELQTQIDREKLQGLVTLAGPRSQGEIRQRLASAQVFALACVAEAGGGSDNLPTVIMEAMACGVPVVSTRLAGVPEMIEDGIDGCLVESGDSRALADAMAQLLGDREKAGRIGEAGRLAAMEKFAVEKTTSQVKHLLVKHAGVPPTEAARHQDPYLQRSGVWKRLWRFLRY